MTNPAQRGPKRRFGPEPARHGSRRGMPIGRATAATCPPTLHTRLQRMAPAARTPAATGLAFPLCRRGAPSSVRRARNTQCQRHGRKPGPTAPWPLTCRACNGLAGASPVPARSHAAAHLLRLGCCRRTGRRSGAAAAQPWRSRTRCRLGLRPLARAAAHKYPHVRSRRTGRGGAAAWCRPERAAGTSPLRHHPPSPAPLRCRTSNIETGGPPPPAECDRNWVGAKERHPTRPTRLRIGHGLAWTRRTQHRPSVPELPTRRRTRSLRRCAHRACCFARHAYYECFHGCKHGHNRR